MNGRFLSMSTIEPAITTARDYRHTVVAGLYAVAAFWGMSSALSSNSLVYYLTAVLMACLATAWCAMDARRRGKPMLPVLKMITFFVWPVAVPIYLERVLKLPD